MLRSCTAKAMLAVTATAVQTITVGRNSSASRTPRGVDTLVIREASSLPSQSKRRGDTWAAGP
ncbi:hypothetical protein GCM10009805_03410 [Leucobacter chromiireducens subsp. solipictus]